MSISARCPRRLARPLPVIALTVALPLAATGCTSIDQSFGLEQTDLALASTAVPKVDVVTDDVVADDTSANVPIPITNANVRIDTAEPTATDQTASAATVTSAINETTVAALPVPAAPVVDVASARADAPPVLALREQPKRTSPFGFLSRERKTKPTRRTTRAKASLKSNMNGLATADVGVQTRSSPRRSVTVIKPKAKAADAGVLPGVRSKATIFGIAKGKMEDGAFRVASAAGLARGSSTRSFVKQTANVSTECFKPDLVAALAQIERKFGQKVVVTSGYRSPKGNRRAGGAKKSKHMTCEAADIQVPGVSKAKLASYLRSMPNRGGVGTYCHTKSVHYDIGSKRDWSWGCRRR